MKEKPTTGFGAEIRKIRAMSGKEATAYLWDYYKLPALLIVGILAVAISVTVSISQSIKHPPKVNCTVLSDYFSETESYLNNAAAQLFPDDPTISVASISSMDGGGDPTANMQLLTYAAAGQIDLLLCDRATLDYLSDSERLIPLDELEGVSPENSVYYTVAGTETLCAVDVTDTVYGALVGCTADAPLYLALFSGTDRSEAAWAMANYLMTAS